MMSRAIGHARNAGQPERTSPERRVGRLAAVAAVTTAAAMVPTMALASGSGTVGPAARLPTPSSSSRAAGGPTGSGVTVSGVISTVAGGPGGPARATRVALRSDCGVTFAGGNMYIADGGSVRQVSQGTGLLTTPAGTGEPGPPGDGRLAAKGGALSGSCGVVTDHAGNLVIADGTAQRLRVVAAGTGTFYGQAMIAKHMYTVAGTGKTGFSGDGGQATAATFHGPIGVAVDAAGNLVVADQFNGRVRVVAVKTGTFYGRAMTAGDVYTMAGGGSSLGDGGPATSALLTDPTGVAVDGAGNLLIADSLNNRVRLVAAKNGIFYGHAVTAGDIYTVAGDGSGAFGGDGGPGSRAQVHLPIGVAIDGRGNLLIADTQNNRIRVVARSSGTFYGKAMTVGDIYTVAGIGTPGFSATGARRPQRAWTTRSGLPWTMRATC